MAVVKGTESLSLRCPYCGEDLLVHVEYDHTATIECASVTCGARWDSSGYPQHTPTQFQEAVQALAARYAQRYPSK